MGRNVWMFCIDSVNIDSIECIRDPCPVLTVSTYIGPVLRKNVIKIVQRDNFCQKFFFFQINITNVFAFVYNVNKKIGRF